MYLHTHSTYPTCKVCAHVHVHHSSFRHTHTHTYMYLYMDIPYIIVAYMYCIRECVLWRGGGIYPSLKTFGLPGMHRLHGSTHTALASLASGTSVRSIYPYFNILFISNTKTDSLSYGRTWPQIAQFIGHTPWPHQLCWVANSNQDRKSVV